MDYKRLETSDAFHDRAKAAFLGLALGDAYGRPLEFVQGPDVRTDSISIVAGQFHWTDDTHMALYLGKAILDVPAQTLSRGEFGNAVGKRFVEWSHDPLTPSTAPGGTCLNGAENFEQTGRWTTSGILGSDGCGAVMRICPLVIAFRGEALIEAAMISACVTHRHPNATAAAIAACHMLRELLEGNVFNAQTVERAIEVLDARADPRQSVGRALDAALKLADSKEKWLDENAIPEFDGGWRCSSALGLAVAAALRSEDSFETVVDRAARIYGDSDSVACLAGMFTAAARGPDCLPKAWLAALPHHEQIESLADALAARPVIETVSRHDRTIS